jgi:hypothetical protein
VRVEVSADGKTLTVTMIGDKVNNVEVFERKR